MNIIEQTKLHRKDTYFRIFNTNDKELVVIEPGYIINMHAYTIWRLLDEEKNFKNLVDCVKKMFNHNDCEKLEKKLRDIVMALYKRNLIEIDGQTINQYEYSYGEALTEIDLHHNYRISPITQVDFVVTTGCNFRCKHCFINQSENNYNKKIELEDWKYIVDMLCNRGLVSVVITGGEPLTCNYIFELMDYIDSIGLKIQLLTNGYLFNKNSIQRISKYKNLTVQVSLDGSNSNSNEFQRGRGLLRKQFRTLNY